MKLVFPITLAAIALSAPGIADDGQNSLFNRIVYSVEHSPADKRALLATIALEQLAAAYKSEARLAESNAGARSSRQHQWSRAVEGYAIQLLQLKQNIVQGEDVLIISQPMTAPTLVVGDYQVMLMHPRPDEQFTFEHHVLETFCQQENCEGLLAGEASAAATPSVNVVRRSVKPKWEFTINGPACLNEGIRIAFDKGADFDSVRTLCRGLFQEIAALLDALQWQYKLQVVIDWETLRLEKPTGQSQHLLQINASGDTAEINAPLLYKTPRLIGAITPWLQARLEGREHQLQLKARQQEGNADSLEFDFEHKSASSRTDPPTP